MAWSQIKFNLEKQKNIYDDGSFPAMFRSKFILPIMVLITFDLKVTV